MDTVLIEELDTIKDNLTELRKMLRRLITKTDLRHELTDNKRILLTIVDNELDNSITVLSLLILSLKSRQALSNIEDVERQGIEEREEESYRFF
jgi:hypothetical protein